MTRKRPQTITFRADERARIPFAVVGVFLLLTSVAIVGVLSTRTAPETNVDVSVAMDQAFAGAQSEVRGGIQTATRKAAQEPVTGTDVLASTPVANAIGDLAANDEEVFRNYVKLRIYLQIRRNLAPTTQTVGDVRTETSLPAVSYTQDSVEEAIDRVHLETGLESASLEPGTLNVTIEGVTATAYRDESEVGTRTENVTVTVGTTVFPLHQKVQTYEQRLNSGDMADMNSLRTQVAARLYPLSWAKAGFERVKGRNPTPAVVPGINSTFHSAIENREVAVMANSGVFAVQQRTFGTKDPEYLESMAPAWTCLATKTVSKISSRRRANQIAGLSCDATSFLFTDRQLPLPNSITSLLDGVDQSVKDQTYATRRNVTINVSKFAYPAKQDVLDEPIEWSDPDSPMRNDWQGDEYDGRNRPPNSSDASDRQMPTTFNSSNDLATKVIEEIYSAQANYTASSSHQGSVPEASDPGSGRDWNQKSDDVEWRDSEVEVTSFDKRFSESGTISRRVTYYDVTVEVNREARNVEEWEECTDRNATTGDCENWRDHPPVETSWEDIGYTLSFTIEGTRSLHADAQARGVAGGFGEGGSPNPYAGSAENFDTVPEEAVRRTTTVDLANGSELTAAKVKNAIDADDVGSESDLRDEILNQSHSQWHPAPADRDRLEAWLAEDINRTLYPEVNESFDPIDISIVQLLQSDNPYQQFLDQIADRREDLTYEGSGAYGSAPALARAEARHLFFEEMKRWIRDINERRQQSEQNANDELPGSTSIDEGMANAQRFLSNQGSLTLPTSTDPGTVDTQLMGNVSFRVDGAPSYLSLQPVMGNTVPAVRPAGEGPEDPENTIHAPFASKVSGGPMPGLPVVPLPGYWVASVNAWDVQLQGEYARFSVTAQTDDPTGSKATTYVRQEQPVSVEINGVDRRVGKVPALNFSNNVPVVVAMPGGTVMPKGTLGTGEREGMGKKHAFTECSATWKFVGPGYTMNKRTPDTVGDPTMCANQAGENGPAVELLFEAQSDGLTHALGEVAEDELEERMEETMAGPTNIMEEEDDDDEEEIEETGVRDPKFVVEFLEPGDKGAAILVRRIVDDDSSKENKTMLVDTGNYGDNNDIVQKLDERSIEEIDHLVITHNDSDHIGGLILSEHTRSNKEGLLSSHPDEITIENLYFNGVLAKRSSGVLKRDQDTLQDVLSGMAIDRDGLSAGDDKKIDLGNEVDVNVLNPPEPTREKGDGTCRVKETDCNSIVLKITKDSQSFLLSSDIRNSTERNLRGRYGDVDVLQLAHHGGASSNGVLSTLDYDVAVFTGGERDNPPERISPQYNTYRDGDIKFIVDEDGVLIGPDEPVRTDD